jgi:cytochrome P450
MTSVERATIDLLSDEFHEDPYPMYARLRAEAPVFQEPRFGGYLLTRFADVSSALRDHETFSSASGVGPRPTPGNNLTIVTSDPPRHTQMRALVNRAFTPRRVAELRPRIEAIARDLLDSLPGTEFDLVHQVSYPLPMIVIAELLGIPAEDRERFKRWSDALVGTFDRDPASFAADGAEMFAYFFAAYAERRTAPRDDLLSALVEAEIEGDRLNDIELLSFAIILLVAGNETTTNLVGNLVNILAGRPDLWAALRADRSLVGPAIEETLRYDSPVQLLGRAATRDVEIHGVTIPAGARVLVGFASANRDPEEFAGPDIFRLDRNLSRHVAFGHGIHYCLGAPLARTEAEIVLNALLNRFATIEPAGAGSRTKSSVIRGFEHLPVTVN